jgi:hypothetical protein
VVQQREGKSSSRRPWETLVRCPAPPCIPNPLCFLQVANPVAHPLETSSCGRRRPPWPAETLSSSAWQSTRNGSLTIAGRILRQLHRSSNSQRVHDPNGRPHGDGPGRRVRLRRAVQRRNSFPIEVLPQAGPCVEVSHFAGASLPWRMRAPTLTSLSSSSL